MKQCSELEQLMTHWENKGEVSLQQLEFLKTHIRSCRKKCRRFAPLLPLLEKDAGLKSLSCEPPAAPSVHAKVMARIISRSPGEKRFSRHLLHMTAAAVVVVLLAAGMLVGRWGAGRTEDFVLVKFELTAAEAESVFLVGDFSGWDPEQIPLEGPNKEGNWSVKIKLKKQQTYTYNFLVNGEIWIPDPRADLTVDDGFGGMNSIIKL